MDDENDGAYARLPEIEDVVTLCRSLNEAGVRYVLIGGFAVVAHGSARGTKDIDLLVDPSIQNIQRIKAAMAYLPDNAIAQIEDTDVQQYIVVRIGDAITVELMAKACQIDLAQLMTEGIEHIIVDNVRIPIPTKEQLIRMKDTVRPKDLSDINYLKQRIEAESES
jgi:predicted nucleotidyltransferase